MTDAKEILDFWFDSPQGAQEARVRPEWFEAHRAFDEIIRHRFSDAVEMAARGDLDSWIDDAHGALALLLLLDQFPRNLFRGSARAFATDEQARRVARESLARGYDKGFPPVARWFFYLPFEHSEDAGDQDRSVDLFASLGDDEASAYALDFARRHRDVILRFGRFPDTNEALGRSNTAEERAFLAEGRDAFAKGYDTGVSARPSM